jgi:hypothetical protein
MSNPSNLYAEKIYSEHPLIFWALDDKADYVDLISESQRNIEDNWTVSGGTAIELSYSDEPFPDSITSRLQGNVPPENQVNEILCISSDVINANDLNQELGTFCVGTYFYSTSAYLNSISIGYEYTDPDTSLVVQNFKTYETDLFQAWGFVSETFDIPNKPVDIRFLIKIKTISGGLSESSYRFFINGISLGQWSENFNTKSLGVVPENFPSEINISTTDKVVPAAAYGISENQGYYIVKDNGLIATNTGIPLVYGASGLTKITPNVFEKPSLIIPGMGFLNEVGRYKEYTVEFWASIDSNSINSQRIFGPISGSNGLYVEGGFLTLVVGDSFASHFVGEWSRPMLLHIRLIKDSITLLVNGEQVISLVIDTETLVLPEEFVNQKSQDWLGFYAYGDVSSVNIDCIAIYSYQIPITVAKRRWVYGQGVSSPEGINSAYGGTSTFIDYSFANYASNYTYPDFAQWQQGSFDNLITTSTSLTTPEYALPEIFLSSKTLNNLYNDCLDIQEVSSSPTASSSFITFRPNSNWNQEHGYFNFDKLNILNEQVNTIYGVFSTTDIEIESGGLVEPKTLVKIYNTLNGDYFIIKQEEDVVKYSLFYNGQEEEIYSTQPLESGQLFSVGINLTNITNYFGNDLLSFFGNRNGLKVYLGGDEDPANTFTGNIYSFGFCTEFNDKKISEYFLDSGVAIFDDLSISGIFEEENAIGLLSHTASYNLLPTQEYNKFFLDVGVSGHWQDYIPLSYFAKFVSDSTGSQYYDLDFLQFNIRYPAIEKTDQNNLDLYDTSGQSVKSYISFQYIEDGANKLQDSFAIQESPRVDGVLDIDQYPSWQTTKFEVLDNTVIYPSKSIDFNSLAIVVDLDFNIRGTLSKPIKINKLEFASQALSNNSFNSVNTRFGVKLFPYKRSGIYYDYKSQNPFTIYKGSTPYLYLNKKTGIGLQGQFSKQIDRGIAIPINKELASNYRVSSIQSWIRYNKATFSSIPTSMFEINYKGDSIVFYALAIDSEGKRARVYAKNKTTGLAFTALSYYWNGSLVREPVITNNEWGVLGVSFSRALNFDAYLGGINLTGPILFNNISYYQANNLQQVQSTINRPWLRVKNDGELSFDWQYWNSNFIWQDVLVVNALDLYGVNPEIVHKTYIGTNKIIIDDSEGMVFDAEKVKVYSNLTWQTQVKTPV